MDFLCRSLLEISISGRKAMSQTVVKCNARKLDDMTTCAASTNLFKCDSDFGINFARIHFSGDMKKDANSLLLLNH